MDKKSDKTYLAKLIDTRPTLLLGVILLLALLLRLTNINSREIFYDDAFSFWLSINDFGAIVMGTVADTMPPLYYFLLHIWGKGSQAVWFLRLLNVFLSMAALGFVFHLAQVWFGKKQALVAVLLTAVLPFQIYHAQELRMYVLLMLGQLGYFYYLYQYITMNTKQALLAGLAVLFGLIAMYAHNLAIFTLITVNLFYFLQPGIKVVKKLLLVQAFVGVGFIPWLIFLPQQISKIQTAFWTPRPGLLEIMQAVLSWFSFLPMTLSWTIVAAVLISQAGALVLYWSFRNRNRRRLIFIGMIFLPGLLLLSVSYLMRPVFVPRAMITSSVLFLILVGDFVVHTWQQQIGKFVLVSLLAAGVVGLPFFYQFESFPRSSFRDAAFYLEKTTTDRDLILHDNKLSYFPMRYYTPQVEQRYLADMPGSHNDTLALASQEVLGMMAEADIEQLNLEQNVYFVVFDKAIQEYQAENIAHPGIQRLAQNHTLAKTIHFGDLAIYHFEVVP